MYLKSTLKKHYLISFHGLFLFPKKLITKQPLSSRSVRGKASQLLKSAIVKKKKRKKETTYFTIKDIED